MALNLFQQTHHPEYFVVHKLKLNSVISVIKLSPETTWESTWEEETQHYSNGGDPLSDLSPARESNLVRDDRSVIPGTSFGANCYRDDHLRKPKIKPGRLKKMYGINNEVSIFVFQFVRSKISK